MLVLLCLLVLVAGCGKSPTEKAIDQKVYERLLATLSQGEFVKIASHFRTKPEIDRYMDQKQAKVFHVATTEEDGRIYDDYRPADTSTCIGFTLVYDPADKRLVEIGVGVSERLAAAAEALLPQAIDKVAQKSEPPYLARQLYEFGYVPLRDRRIAIGIEKFVLPKQSLYSVVYRIEPVTKAQ